MSNIPDFVQQIQEIERNLKAQWNVTRQIWLDQQAERFDESVMQPFCQNFQDYITGNNLTGYGVDELVKRMDKHLQDMSSLTGVPANYAFAMAGGCQHATNGEIRCFGGCIDVEDLDIVKDRGGVIHDERRDRDYWCQGNHGVKPGELQNKDILDIEKYR